MKGMLKNHRLAQAISDVSWSEFFRQLAYKMELRGGELLKVETFYPSSQTCSVCGYQNTEVKNLGVREWTCRSAERITTATITRQRISCGEPWRTKPRQPSIAKVPWGTRKLTLGEIV